MSKPPPSPPSLAELRQEIDSIDAQVHSLLMQRGDIIDRLIQVKQTQEVGFGFPPGARGRHDAPPGAASSRHPAARHRREHLARHHLDLHLRPGAVLGACRCFGRRIRDAGFGAVSFRLHRALRVAFQCAGRGRGGRQIQGRSGAGVGDVQPHAVVDRARGKRRAEDHRAAAVCRARRPSGGTAGFCGVARCRQRHGDRSRDVERARLRLERRNRPRAVAAGRDRRRARHGLRRRGPSGVGGGRDTSKRSRPRWSRPAPRCAHRPSSAATQRAIRCRTDRRPNSRPRPFRS